VRVSVCEKESSPVRTRVFNSPSKANMSVVLNDSTVEYQTYESFIKMKTDEDDQAPVNNFLSDKIYDKIVRKVIKLNAPKVPKPHVEESLNFVSFVE